MPPSSYPSVVRNGPIAAPQLQVWQLVAETAFVAFLLLVFVGLTPFTPRSADLLRQAAAASTGQGDLLRQISYLAAFGVIALCALRKHGIEVLALVPFLLTLLLGWCLLSASWADQGGVTFRRAGLEVIIVVTAMWGVHTVGLERSLVLFRAVAIGILIVNWISIPLTDRAIHQPGEIDPSIVGAWRGLYFHKNIAGAVSAISAMLFLFFAIDRRSALDWFLCLASLAFLVMTKSKSSMGLLVPALLAAVVYRSFWQRGLDRAIVMVSAVLLALVVATVALLDWSTIARVISDPTQFTGRTEVWAAEAAYIFDHPIFGAGYGSFNDTGAVSPLHNYVNGDWVEAISHGHNGYLQMTVEIGFVGFVLAILALVIQPATAFWRRDAVPQTLKAFLLALFVFLVLHNFLESDFLESDGPAWVAFLIMLAWLRQARALLQDDREQLSWA
ncbi:MAG TPA: O-antigen ligase family protein [Rhizomicrobium sp.]